VVCPPAPVAQARGWPEKGPRENESQGKEERKGRLGAGEVKERLPRGNRPKRAQPKKGKPKLENLPEREWLRGKLS